MTLNPVLQLQVLHWLKVLIGHRIPFIRNFILAFIVRSSLYGFSSFAGLKLQISPTILISLECAGCQQRNGTSQVWIRCMLFEKQLFLIHGFQKVIAPYFSELGPQKSRKNNVLQTHSKTTPTGPPLQSVIWRWHWFQYASCFSTTRLVMTAVLTLHAGYHTLH